MGDEPSVAETDRSAIGWARVLVSGAAVSAVVPVALCAVGWAVAGSEPEGASGTGPNAMTVLFFLLSVPAAGAAAATVVRLLRLGRTGGEWTWVAGAKAVGGILVGGFIGFGVTLGLALASFRAWYPVHPESCMYGFVIFPWIAAGAMDGALVGLVCPLWWGRVATSRARRTGDEPSVADD